MTLRRSHYACDGVTKFYTIRENPWPPRVTDSYEYDAYGNSFTVSGTTPNEMMYRGEQYDSDLGLYYLRARYYNPATGRFMSRDPESGKLADPKSLHKYLYAGGDPINAMDPSGRVTLLQAVYISAAATIAYTVWSERSQAKCIGDLLNDVALQLEYPSYDYAPSRQQFDECLTDLVQGFLQPILWIAKHM